MFPAVVAQLMPQCLSCCLQGVFYVDESKVPKEEPKTASWWQQGASMFCLSSSFEDPLIALKFLPLPRSMLRVHELAPKFWAAKLMNSWFSSNTLLVKLVFNWTFLRDETGLKQQRTDSFLWTCLALQGVADPSKQLAGSRGMSQCPNIGWPLPTKHLPPEN